MGLRFEDAIADFALLCFAFRITIAFFVKWVISWDDNDELIGWEMTNCGFYFSVSSA